MSSYNNCSAGSETRKGLNRLENPDYQALKSRLRRRLAYPQDIPMDRLSLDLSELAVSYFGKQSTFDSLDLDFAARLSRDGCVHPCTLVMALVYLERLRFSDSDHFLCSDPADLYVTALLLASKYLVDDGEDEHVYNDEWATSAGMSLKHVNRMEVSFLKRIDWNLNIRWQEFEEMLNMMEARVSLSSGKRRGWHSYAELAAIADCLLKIKSCCALLHAVIIPTLRTIAMLVMGYCVSVIAIIRTSELVVVQYSLPISLSGSMEPDNISVSPRMEPTGMLASVQVDDSGALDVDPEDDCISIPLRHPSSGYDTAKIKIESVRGKSLGRRLYRFDHSTGWSPPWEPGTYGHEASSDVPRRFPWRPNAPFLRSDDWTWRGERFIRWPMGNDRTVEDLTLGSLTDIHDNASEIWLQSLGDVDTFEGCTLPRFGVGDTGLRMLGNKTLRRRGLAVHFGNIRA